MFIFLLVLFTSRKKKEMFNEIPDPFLLMENMKQKEIVYR